MSSIYKDEVRHTVSREVGVATVQEVYETLFAWLTNKSVPSDATIQITEKGGLGGGQRVQASWGEFIG